MALSNWDTLAFDSNGIPCGGVFTAINCKATIEIRKNCAFFSYPSAWRIFCGFSKPYVAQIESGVLRLFSVDIYAKRGPQNAIFLYLEEWYNFGKNKELKVNRFAGIGAYGFANNGEWVGINKKTYAKFMDFLYSLDVLRGEDAEKWLNNVGKTKPVRFNQGDAFFANAIGTKLQETKIGKAKKPHLINALKS